MIVALLMALFLVGAGGTLGIEESLQLDKLVDENLIFEYDTINTDDLAKVLDASVIEVKLYKLFDKNCHSKEDCGYETYHVLASGDSIIELEDSSVLLAYISSGFKIESETNAKEFERMLDVTFPAFFSSGKEIYQEGNQWVFIREDSFGEKNGVIVVVDDHGVIEGIESASAIERNSQDEENSEVE